MNNLIGQKFGRLTIIQKMDNDKWGHHRYLCQCTCKQKKIILGNKLESGHTKSCGCLQKDTVREIGSQNIKHGHSRGKQRSAIYITWMNIVQRCANPNTANYKYYGGRGITVCERWLKFENFLEDMGERPEGKSLDRVKNNKGYCKENCRWTTQKEQARNRRDNRLIFCFGRLQCISAWSEETNIKTGTIIARLDRRWSTEKTLTTPVLQRKNK